MTFLKIKPPTSGHQMEPSVLILDPLGSIPGLRDRDFGGSWAIPRRSPIQVLTRPDPASLRDQTRSGVLRVVSFIAIISLEQHDQGRARTQSPTTRNYAIEIPTFGEFARVSNSLSAMAEPRYGWTTFLIMVSPLPGKYELYTFRWAERCPRVFPRRTVAKHSEMSRL